MPLSEPDVAFVAAQPGDLAAALAEWGKVLGRANILDGPTATTKYGVCTTGVTRSIAGGVCPREAEDVQAVVRIANKYRIPLYPISTGHNWGYGTANPADDHCVILDLSGLNRICAMNERLGYVTVEPGVTQGHLWHFLNDNHLPFMVPVTGAGPTCSLMANALERGFGITPHTDHFGAVMSLEAVLPNGEMYHSALTELGGDEIDKIFKWGIGPYVDGLFSQGNFGIVTQMTIALAPKPKKTKAFFFWLRSGADLEGIVEAMQEVMNLVGGNIGSINLMNARRVLAMTIANPKGAAKDGPALSGEMAQQLAQKNRIPPWMITGAIYGEPEIVKATEKIIRRILSPFATKVAFMDSKTAERLNNVLDHLPFLAQGALGRIVRTVGKTLKLLTGMPVEIALPIAYWASGAKPTNDLMNPAKDGCGLIWYPPLVPMEPARVRSYVTMVETICTQYGIDPLITLTSISNRCMCSSVPLLFDRSSDTQVVNANNCYNALLNAGKKDGILPYRMGVHSMSVFTESGMPFWTLVGKLKEVLDPNNIIAPGRYAPPRTHD